MVSFFLLRSREFVESCVAGGVLCGFEGWGSLVSVVGVLVFLDVTF